MGMEGMSQPAEDTMMKTEATCSRCGGADVSAAGKGLSLVTIPYDGGQGAGRILVYCRSCWTDMAELVAEVIPLEMVSLLVVGLPSLQQALKSHCFMQKNVRFQR